MSGRATTREELYRLAWSEPMNKIGERFKVSGTYVAGICTLLKVPRPEMGYWSKLALQFANDLYDAFESAGHPVAMAAKYSDADNI